MRQKALVSIIVPVYQAVSVLDRTIESLLAQTYRPIEILLVDDGSTDGSGKICDLYAEQYDEIRVFHQNHAGVSHARNCGIKAAKGKYIQFTDADDEISPSFIEKLVETLEVSCADMALCGYEVVSENNSRTERFTKGIYSKSNAEDVYAIIMQNMLSVTWNKLYIKSKIKHLYDSELFLSEDSVFCVAYFMDNHKVATCSDVLYRYYVNDGNLNKQEIRVSGYNGIKQYFAYNRRLLRLCTDERQSAEAMQHICKVFYYGVYTYIFEPMAKIKHITGKERQIMRSILQDTLYQKAIRKIQAANIKERIYRLVSVMQSPSVLWYVLKIRQFVIKWRE